MGKPRFMPHIQFSDNRIVLIMIESKAKVSTNEHRVNLPSIKGQCKIYDLEIKDWVVRLEIVLTDLKNDGTYTTYSYKTEVINSTKVEKKE